VRVERRKKKRGEMERKGEKGGKDRERRSPILTLQFEVLPTSFHQHFVLRHGNADKQLCDWR